MVQIHQIYYLDRQRPFLDPAFIPYDNRENLRPQWAEYHVFRKEYAARPCPEGALVGYFSWKFAAKSRISGRRFVDFVNENPGYDVYFVNPFPLHANLFRSVWAQGEHYHPGITAFAQAVIRHAGYDVDLAAMIHDRSTLAFCNYWVGNRTFWDKYMKLTGDVEEVLLHRLTPEEHAFLHTFADYGNNTLSHIAFVLERLFSTLLSHDPTIKHRAYRYSSAELRVRYGPVRGTLAFLLPERAQRAKWLFRLPLVIKETVQKGLRRAQRLLSRPAAPTG